MRSFVGSALIVTDFLYILLRHAPIDVINDNVVSIAAGRRKLNMLAIYKVWSPPSVVIVNIAPQINPKTEFEIRNIMFSKRKDIFLSILHQFS